MARLEDITRGSSIRGILPDGLVTVIDVKWIGTVAIEVTYKDSAGPARQRAALPRPRADARSRRPRAGPWSFDGDGALFRLVSEAQRIRLAYLFDPLLAVHTSLVEPLPHQITAVYERDAAPPAAALPAGRRPGRRQDDHDRAASSRS